MMTVTKYCLILYTLLALCFTANAQPCSFVLYGTVKDAGNGAALQGATITLIGNTQKAITDAEGHFHFNNLCARQYEAEISYIGYSAQKIAVKLNKNTELDILLHIDERKLATVKIIAKKSSPDALYSSQKLELRELELSRGESLGEALKRIPGVNSIQTGPTISKPVIHGMHSNRILIFNSGVRIEGQQWGNEHAPEVDPFSAKEITVVKGAAGVQYGADALGGIILAEPSALNYHLPFSTEINLVGASNNRMGAFSGKMEGALKNERVAWRLQGTAKKAGNTSAPGYYLNNTGYNELNGSLTLGYKRKNFESEVFLSTFNTTLGIFEEAHIGNLDDLNSRIANGRPFTNGNFSYSVDVPRQEVGHHLLKIKGKKFFSDNSSLNVVYSLQHNQRKEFDRRRGDRSDLPSLDLSLTAQNLEAVYEQSRPNNVYNKYGFNTSIIVNNNIPGTFITPLIPNYDSFNPALFFIKKLEWEKYELEAGVRYDYRFLDAAGYDKDQIWYGGKHEFHNVSGSAGGLFHVKPDFDLRSDLSLTWRAPSVNELYSRGLHHGTASIEYGNSSFESEKGYKWVNTASLSKNRVNVSLSGYINYINNYIFLQPTGTFETSLRGVFPVFQYDQTNALLFGADFSGTYSIYRDFSWRLKGALVRAKDRSNNLFLPMIPADRLDNSLIWEKKPSSRRLSAPFIELQHIFTARQNRYEPASDFAPPPAAYHLFNLSGGMNYKINEQYLGVNASVFNVFNTRYKDYLNRFRYYAHETGRNFVIRLSYKF